MKTKNPNRIVEIHLHRSLKNPRFAHAVAILFPCNHKKYLGLTWWPKYPNLRGRFTRVQTCVILQPIEYEVMEKIDCHTGNCKTHDSWVGDYALSIPEDARRIFDSDDET